MPTLQEQDEDLAGAYSLCGQAALPGAHVDEHCGQDVYETIWYLGSIGSRVGAGRWLHELEWIDSGPSHRTAMFRRGEAAYEDVLFASDDCFNCPHSGRNVSLALGWRPVAFGRVMSGRVDALCRRCMRGRIRGEHSLMQRGMMHRSWVIKRLPILLLHLDHFSVCVH